MDQSWARSNFASLNLQRRSLRIGRVTHVEQPVVVEWRDGSHPRRGGVDPPAAIVLLCLRRPLRLPWLPCRSCLPSPRRHQHHGWHARDIEPPLFGCPPTLFPPSRRHPVPRLRPSTAASVGPTAGDRLAASVEGRARIDCAPVWSTPPALETPPLADVAPTPESPPALPPAVV